MPPPRLTAARSEHQAIFTARSRLKIHTNSAEEPYCFVLNNPSEWYDFLGREPRRNLNVNIQRDSSVPANLGDNDRMLLDSNKNAFKEKIKKCCDDYDICNINVIFKEELDKPKNYVPDDGYGRKGKGLENYNEFSGIAGNGNLPTLLTNRPIDGGNANGLAAQGGGIVMSPRSPGFTLAHEAGHSAGYDGGDQDSNQHNSKQNHLMNLEGGKEIDRCWCEKISKLAK
jgi:hypothetical protein